MFQDAWSCHCRDAIGAQKGEKYRITNEAVLNDSNPESHKKLINAELNCDACPANLIPIAHTAKVYKTCANQRLVELPEELQKYEKLPKTYPFENACTCPEGTVWSWLTMWCIPEEACSPQEIGVPGWDHKIIFFQLFLTMF